jgi:2-oxoglutarate ferredoxin oxidoreductase subunit delta
MTLAINERCCKGCGICIEFCPKQILVLSDKGKVTSDQLDLCIKCGQCELRCPDFAIRVIKEDKGDQS